MNGLQPHGAYFRIRRARPFERVKVVGRNELPMADKQFSLILFPCTYDESKLKNLIHAERSACIYGCRHVVTIAGDYHNCGSREE